MRRQRQRLAGQRRHLAGHADHRQAAGHVRQHVELEDDVAHEVGQRHADGGVVFEEDDALVLVVDAQLEVGQTIASLGTPRILVGFSSVSFFGVGVAVEQHRAGQGRG